jgi:hypothetical protein
MAIDIQTIFSAAYTRLRRVKAADLSADEDESSDLFGTALAVTLAISVVAAIAMLMGMS